ncbi:MAG: hypothetical protein OEM64_05590 [Gammaproteobacteria bacterium]|nr:hypothetical protein [Gammaproteobacteria bacterium]MDH3415768.1 hypothetical protein [Gammaproteobacteria bacterium]
MFRALVEQIVALRTRIRERRVASSRRKVPTQVIQLGVIFLAVGVGMFLMRQKFVPETFGDLGHYRGAAVAANAELEPHYAGWQQCAMCHPDKVETKNRSFHRTVSCETCHGPASDHTSNPMGLKPELPTGREPCLVCHSYLASRPTGFPQVIEDRHNPVRACTGCHDAHDPTPPESIQECSACHNTIARSKAVSPHAPLDCEACHEVQPEHKVQPRAHVPKKPFERAFCGTCHAKGAEAPEEIRGVDLTVYEIPRIDLVTHGGTFVCWQCHYQHSPEAR